jgi:hypothetical protein
MNLASLPHDCSTRFVEVRPTQHTNWNRSDAPQEGALVRVLAEDDYGEYAIPFVVVFKNDSWFNGRTHEELDPEVYIAGWMPWS